MRVLLFVLCAFALLVGTVILLAARSAIHEIEAFVLFLIAAVLLIGAAIVEAINSARSKLDAMLVAVQTVWPAGPSVSTNKLPPPLPYSLDRSEPTESISNLPDPPMYVGVDDSQSDEESATDMFNEARQFAAEGRKDQAVFTLREIIRLYPVTQAAEKARRNLQKSPTSPG